MKVLKESSFQSPLGRMIVIADDEALYLLEFDDARGLEREKRHLKIKTNSKIISGETKIHHRLYSELFLYFESKLRKFETPIRFLGTEFQNHVWEQLKKIPHGETVSYLELAKELKKPKAYRAVAQANGANQLALIVPCHRVINANGNLGGYAGGLKRKQWLLDHEKSLG